MEIPLENFFGGQIDVPRYIQEKSILLYYPIGTTPCRTQYFAVKN